MICQQCRRTGVFSRLLQQPQQARSTTAVAAAASRQQIPTLRQRTHQTRAYSDGKPSVAPPPPSAPRQPVAGDISIPSAVSSASPGISQPLSTPQGVHAEVNPDQKTGEGSKQQQRPPSSCVAGTKLSGLSYEKNKPEVFALEDAEYPDWLWGLVEEFEEKEKADKGGVDPKTMNKKQRKRHEKKLAAQAAALPPKIPVHHQASDITPAEYNRADSQSSADALAEATEGMEKRAGITKSARDARRQAIRESNFLRGL